MCSNKQVTAIAKATIHPDEGGPLVLEYFLCHFTGEEGEALYGLRVDKRSPNGVLIEREDTPALTGSLDDATSLANTFAKGTVPPCVLNEMVDEWLNLLFPSSIHTTRKNYVAASL